VDEIQSNFEQAQALLRSRKSHKITEAEFREQCASYVVGNAFDVFTNTDVVTRKFLKELAQRRLRIAG